MNRTRLVPVTICLIVAAGGFPSAAPVRAFQAHEKNLEKHDKGDLQSENLWLLQVQKAELEIKYGVRHPRVIALTDRIQSVRDQLSCHESPSTTTNDLKAIPGDSPTPGQPAIHAETTKSDSEPLNPRARRLASRPMPAIDAALPDSEQNAEEVLQDRWIVRIYDVASLRPSFEAAADAENLASVRSFGSNSGGGGGTGFFQLEGTRNELAATVKPSVNSGDKQTDVEGIANQGTPPAPQLPNVTWQECLMKMVQELTSPVASWTEVDEAYIKVIEDRLIIRQTREGHEVVADLLDQLTVSLTSSDAAGSSSNSVRMPHDPVREFSRSIDRDSEQKLNELLWTELTPALIFPGKTRLTDILSHISSVLSSRQDQPILISADPGALENDGVEFNDVIINDVEIPEGLMTVGSAFEHILSQTDPQLTLVARDGVFLLTTKTAADAARKTCYSGFTTFPGLRLCSSTATSNHRSLSIPSC